MITFKRVCELGFKRLDIEDHVHFNQSGWVYFIMTKKIKKGVHAEWSPVDHLVTVYKVGEEYDERFVIEDPKEFDLMMKVLL